MSVVSGVLLAVLLAAAPQAGANVEVQAKEIETALIAPCCFRQQVSAHSSPAAEEVRRDVRARLAQGETRQQILDAYVAQYGKRILAEPPAEGFGAALQMAPFFMAIAGVILLVLIVRRLTRHFPAIEPAGGIPLNTEERSRLDEALRDLD